MSQLLSTERVVKYVLSVDRGLVRGRAYMCR